MSRRAGGLRPADGGEAAAISALAMRSKAHWGYGADFLEACRTELTLTAEFIAANPVIVFEDADGIAGFYTLVRWKADIELGHFFVDPPAIGRGVGRALWDHAVETAARLGYERLVVQSDPNAEGFYLKLGAERIGDVPSQIWPNRSLPLLVYPLTDGA